MNNDLFIKNRRSPFGEHRIFAPLVMATIATLVSACGGGDGVDSPPSSSSGTPTATTSPSPTTSTPAPAPAPTPESPPPTAQVADQPYFSADALPSDAKGSVKDPVDTIAVTHHVVTVNGQAIRYTASIGQTTVRADFTSQPIAKISYTAFIKDGGVPEQRPITFIFGDGLGASSATLMLKAFGPRIVASADGSGKFSDNQNTLLNDSDLVFVNPVGTGYSVAIGEKVNGDLWGWTTDSDLSARFITRFLTDNGRMNSPKFMLADGVGCIRGSVASYILRSAQGVAINGVGLISPQWETYTADSSTYSAFAVLPKAAIFPTIAATARYYGRLSLQQQASPFNDFIASVKKFGDGNFKNAFSEDASDDLLESFTKNVSDDAGYQFSPSPDTIGAATQQYSVQFSTLSDFSRNILGPQGGQLNILDTRRSSSDDKIQFENVAQSDIDSYVRGELKYTVGSSFVANNSIMNDPAIWKYSIALPNNEFFPETLGDFLRDSILLSSTIRTTIIDGYYDAENPFYNTDLVLESWALPINYSKTINRVTYESGHSPELSDDLRPMVVSSLKALYRSTLVAMKTQAK